MNSRLFITVSLSLQELSFIGGLYNITNLLPTKQRLKNKVANCSNNKLYCSYKTVSKNRFSFIYNIGILYYFSFNYIIGSFELEIKLSDETRVFFL